MKDHNNRHALPLLSRDNNRRQQKSGFKTAKRKMAKQVRFSSTSKSLRNNLCFRSFLALISLQVFILFLVSLFLEDNLQQGVSRVRTLQLLHDYYEHHFHSSSWDSSSSGVLEESAPPGIIVDDDAKNNNNDREEKGGDDDLHELEDHLANQIEERLNQAEQELELKGSDQSSSSNETTACIDNYYTRQIKKREQIQQRTEDEAGAPFPFLIVGGSDGSGTRAFVTALGKLGIPMLVDDRGTMDVHGKQLFHGEGWPPLVQLVLNHTHSANYKVDDLPLDVRTTVIKELTKFKKEMVKRGKHHDKRELERRNKKHIRVNHYDNTHHIHRQYNNNQHMYAASAFHPPTERNLLEADSFEDVENAALFDVRPGSVVVEALNKSTMVQYGWKAPVSMLLLPFLREVFGPIKFLHVVRDGRDIALSSNQSPVRKFYSSYYGKAALGQDLSSDVTKIESNNTDFMSVLAMQLWNNWNLQVLDYEKAHASSPDFDYLVMHTEDLLNPETKFQSIQQLAHFVGSRSSLSEMCCQSQQAVVDMGESSPAMGEKGHGNRRRNHAYDSWFRNNHRETQHDKFGQGPHQSDEQQHEQDVAQFQQMLAGVNQKNADRHGHLRHQGTMGGDPILSNVHDNDGEDEEEEANQEDNGADLFDNEAGRHNNWHHGNMDAGSLMENARAKHAEYTQHRNDRFKGLQKRVAAHQKRAWQKKGRQKPQQPHKPSEESPPQDFAHRIAANHQARTHQEHANMGVDHSKQDRESMEFLMKHDHEARLEAMHRQHRHESHSVEREHNNGAEHEPPRRRLMSAFHKLGYRPKKQKPSTTKPQEEGLSSPTEHTHRQFKPKRNEGDKVFQERDSPPGGPQPPSTGWSIASISEALGFSSPYSKHSLVSVPTRTSNTVSTGFDQAIVEEFQHMPLLPIHSNRGPQVALAPDRGPNHKRQNAAQVKSRYGKWVTYLEDKPDLSRQLHTLGSQSLKAFGYEPSTARFMDVSGVDDTFQCDNAVVCKEHKKGGS